MDKRATPIVMLLVFSITFAMIYLWSTHDSQIVDNLKCSNDADCVPDSCCHPMSVVNKQFAPDCSDVLCSAECAEGTLDCGQGEIKCINKSCTAIIK